MIISFTGADDLTYPPDLYQLALKAAVEHSVTVEVGLLVFPEKMGQPRNPSYTTRQAIRMAQPTAAHLCGKMIFDAILADDQTKTPAVFLCHSLLEELISYPRIQVNINARRDDYTEEQVHQVWCNLLRRCPSAKIILQYHERSAPWIRSFIQKMEKREFESSNLAYSLFSQFREWDKRIQILIDGSKGKGITPDTWRIPDLELLKRFPIGQAGGLNPDNIKVEYSRFIADNDGLIPQWVDMESGIRDIVRNMLSIPRCDSVILNLVS